MRYYIGTSGYHYKDWKGKYYPEDLKKKDWLEYYSREFETVEINNTFYQIPKEKTFTSWYEQTPAHFKFSIKGSRYVTHMKKLNDPDEGLNNVYHAIAPLREKIDCVLWQLPGNFHFNREKLENFGKACSKDYVNVLEFRHESWFSEECFNVLSKYDLAYCMISAPGNLPDIAAKTAATAYLRFHGKGPGWYNYDYSKEELMTWIRKIGEVNPTRMYVYFNNDYDARAIKNARELREMVHGVGPGQ